MDDLIFTMVYGIIIGFIAGGYSMGRYLTDD